MKITNISQVKDAFDRNNIPYGTQGETLSVMLKDNVKYLFSFDTKRNVLYADPDDDSSYVISDGYFSDTDKLVAEVKKAM